MFSGLDAIDWDQLIHAYGPASDVPEDIRALVHSDEKIAKAALSCLFGSIYHQGTCYTATAPAVPFLAEAAIALKPERGAAVLNLLSALVEPTADYMYDAQITAEALRAEVNEEEKALSAEALAECKEFGFPPTVEADVYEAVIAQIPQLISALDVSHRDIQINLFELLGNFPKHHQEALELAEKALFCSGEDEVLQVAAIECLSRLERSVEKTDFGFFFEKLMPMHGSPFLKAHVALAKKDQTEAGLDELLSVLAQAEKLYEIDRQSKRGKGWTVCHIANALKPWAALHKDRIGTALIGCFPAAQKFGADTCILVDALMDILASPQASKGFFSHKQAQDLTLLEKQALRQIVEFGSWKIGDNWFGNFTMQMASYGLPDKPDALQQYLKT